MTKIASIVLLAAMIAVPMVCSAQTPPPKAATVATGETVLSALRYDAKSTGVLLLVGEPTGDGEPHPPAYWRKTLRGRTPAQFAETINRRVLTVGAITALVPRTMIVLNTRPGKPDPFAELRGDDRLLLLMAQWTPEQWAKAGSDTGIGAGDLTDEQRPLFAGMLPADAVKVRTYNLEPN
ncbi:MAG: hypothetical protein H7Y38_04135 [Armatimonadetes bacterium]|nr:hypothetical protein [Armatimonadota bacterium]